MSLTAILSRHEEFDYAADSYVPILDHGQIAI